MKILVTGGRFYDNAAYVFRVLDAINPGVIIHGGATGADALAHRWAELRRKSDRPYFVLRQDWKRLGPKAGPLRNQRMLDDNPDVAFVVAFPGGTGTADMMRRALAAGKSVYQPVVNTWSPSPPVHDVATRVTTAMAHVPGM